MTLRVQILAEINQGTIPCVFCVDDLLQRAIGGDRYMVGERDFSENTLKTFFANYAISADSLGRHLDDEQNALFVRVRPGIYTSIYKEGDGNAQNSPDPSLVQELQRQRESLHDRESDLS